MRSTIAGSRELAWSWTHALPSSGAVHSWHHAQQNVTACEGACRDSGGTKKTQKGVGGTWGASDLSTDADQSWQRQQAKGGKIRPRISELECTQSEIKSQEKGQEQQVAPFSLPSKVKGQSQESVTRDASMHDAQE